jgi:AcrR family transcriptional regulator
MSPKKMTGKHAEMRAKTRERLMKAADKLFCHKGMAHASIDDVAAEAGYTKGAFYANFASKEELFLAMLDERFAERIAVVDNLLTGSDDAQEAARAGGVEFFSHVSSDREWERLFFEFAAHAARDESFREELVARYRTLIDRMALAMGHEAERLGIHPPGPVEHFAIMVFAAANGMALQQLLDPESVPEDLFGGMMELLVLGTMAKSAAQAAEASTS